MFLGVIILSIGILFILKALGIISASSWTFFWGILLLVIGLKMVMKKKNCIHCDWFGYCDHHKKNGDQ